MRHLALVGVAHIHTPGFIEQLVKRSGLRASRVWDWEPKRGKLRAGELGASYSDNLEEIARDPEISGCIICSETNRHLDLVTPLAAAKKDIFIEKPIGVAATDSYAIADIIERTGVRFQTGYRHRGDPIMQFLTKQVTAGSFGMITRTRASVCHGGALGRWFDTDWKWMTDLKQAGCGAFGDLGTHGLDILLCWNKSVERVTATLSAGTRVYDCEQFGEAIIQFKDGAIGTLAASWDDCANPVSYEICGTEGHAVVMNDRLFFQSKHVQGADGKSPWTKLPAYAPAGFDAFMDAMEGKPAMLVGVRDAAYRVTVMEAMYEGAQSNKWTTLR